MASQSPADSPGPRTAAAALGPAGLLAGAEWAGHGPRRGDEVVLDLTMLGDDDARVGMTPAVASPAFVALQLHEAAGGAIAVAEVSHVQPAGAAIAQGNGGGGGGGPPAGQSISPMDETLEAEILREMEEVSKVVEQPWIWRVHPSIRAEEEKAYGPKLVSIGPYHHGEDSLLPMENIKLVYLKNLLSRSKANDISDCVLKKYGILVSKLGSDEEVAKMFNALCKGAHLNYENHPNALVFGDLNAYFNVPHHKWRASLKTVYFNSPWSTISLFAGFLLLFLTAVQPYLTAFPRH